MMCKYGAERSMVTGPFTSLCFVSSLLIWINKDFVLCFPIYGKCAMLGYVFLSNLWQNSIFFQSSTIKFHEVLEGLFLNFFFRFVQSESPRKKQGQSNAVKENWGVDKHLTLLWLIATPSAKVSNFGLMTWSHIIVAIIECPNRSSAIAISLFYPLIH